MNTKPSIFSFESSCQIRMFMIDGEPWFVTKDVCNALNIDVTQARKLDKKGWNKKGLYSIQTPGGIQELSIVSESGLYILILRCKEAMTEGTRAFRFLEWVTGEVLPQIRRTGSYIKNSLPQEERIKMVADQVANATASAVMQAMKIENKTYSSPLKPGYRSLIHSPSGVLGLTENSLLMNLLNQLQEDGHDVSGAAAELTTMFCYIVGVSKCLRDIQTHAEYINDKAGFF
ncbi:BRO-like protein [Escherichia coli]|uniref:BRO-N domain-containing protein n=1 Tax=Escherichia coli TaxID=562 RepID=UPI000B7C71F4|nr:BRO family protein [Escherichia coli]EFI9200927.1 BRO-like protein [Escherichia coli]EFK7796030.1 BRO-like protein [Escherichia coli]MBB7330753.1 BRO-like protein [Escherichia coli]MDF9369479.1 BRO family protein [Escherichia coli]